MPLEDSWSIGFEKTCENVRPGKCDGRYFDIFFLVDNSRFANLFESRQ